MECLTGADCERALTTGIETAAIKIKLPICRESVNPDCFVAVALPTAEPDETTTPAEEWDKTAKDCRNCVDFEDCQGENRETMRALGDDTEEDYNVDDEDCFEPIDDD
jgi:hypothetical protein